jgi:phosphatidylserine decarboxylase
MLDHSAYTDSFVGGDVFQSFLSGADYHRWRSPIDGVVKEARVVNGLMFSELASEGYDSSAGTKSQGYEASVNTRGLVFIQSDDPAIGMVCVIPIGITEISSVSIQVKAGQRVKKGDELGYFSYGGSSMALVFQPGAIRKFTVTLPEGESEKSRPTLKVNGQIAIAN